MPPRKFRVLVAPYFPENPYQRELQEALRLEGVAVSNATLAADMLRFRRRFRYTRPHVLHLHWPDKYCIDRNPIEAVKKTVSFLRDLSYVKKNGTKIVWTIHNLMNHDQRNRVLERVLQRWLVRNCSAFIAHSEAGRARARKYLGIAENRIFRVIPLGNSVATYPNTLSREEARKELGIAPERFVYLFFGRIQEYKAVDELLDAFATTRALDDSTLIVAGDPSADAYGDRIRTAATRLKNVITQFSHVSDDRIQVYMNAADVVVTPYRRILTSSASMLAMTFGKPIVAPNFEELVETIPPSGAIYYDSRQPSSLAPALLKARAERTKLTAMGEANLARARELSWDKIAKLTTALYLKLRSKNVFLRAPSGQRVIERPSVT